MGLAVLTDAHAVGGGSLERLEIAMDLGGRGDALTQAVAQHLFRRWDGGVIAGRLQRAGGEGRALGHRLSDGGKGGDTGGREQGGGETARHGRIFP